MHSFLRHLIVSTLLFSSLAIADERTEIQTLLDAEKFQSASARISTLLSTKPKDPQLRFLKGIAQSGLGQTKEASSTFLALTVDYPELPEPHNNLAVIYSQQGQFSKARISLETAIRINPNYATAHENLGQLYYDLAAKSYESALKLNPHDAASKRKLAILKNGGGVTVSGVKIEKPKSSHGTATPAISPSPEIETFVAGWAAAWNQQDLPVYFSHYSAAFKPSKSPSVERWKTTRTERILGREKIQVKIEHLNIVKANGDFATVQFIQNYHSNAFSDHTYKTLKLHKSDGKWQIISETAHASL